MPSEAQNTYILLVIQGNLSLMNLKWQKILCFIAGVLLLLVLFTTKLTTKGLEIKFFIAEILLLKGSLYWGFSVTRYSLTHFRLILLYLGVSGLWRPMRSPWEPQTNIGQFICVFLVGIYLCQAIWGLNHLDVSGYIKIYPVIAHF